jgi:hypothetical protein
VKPRAGLDEVEKRKFFNLPGLELLPLGHPARSQSLYRLRYSGCISILFSIIFAIIMDFTRLASALNSTCCYLIVN